MSHLRHSAINFNNRIIVVEPTIVLIAEIEDELGSIPVLAEKFMCREWKVTDLVTLIHMMLAAAGQDVDYRILGNSMVREGLGAYLAASTSFLRKIIDPKNN